MKTFPKPESSGIQVSRKSWDVFLKLPSVENKTMKYTLKVFEERTGFTKPF